LVQLVSEFVSMEACLLACLVKVVKPNVTNEQVAQACGASVRSLYCSTSFMTLKASLRLGEISDPPPRGSKDDEGNLEAVPA
jgi:hypothetical protein